MEFSYVYKCAHYLLNSKQCFTVTVSNMQLDQNFHRNIVTALDIDMEM